ncbi:phosphatidylcholine translocator ABCB4-like, partial [Physella acuta]|uniref:phosphatidylcholine translocator ABCB4-like n=1 Tax=Physella acuta TaxID=109671 RepID=UPI0027DD3331
MTFISNGKDPEKRRLVENEKTKSKSRDKSIGYWALFRCADTRDIVMMLTGVILSVAIGAVSTTNLIVYSSFIGSYIDKISAQNLLSDVREFFVERNMSLGDVFSNGQILKPYCEDLVTYTNGSLVCEDLISTLDNSREVFDAILESLGISMVMLVGGTIAQALFGWTAQRQVLKIRQRLYSKIICQDVAWFDNNKPGDLAVKMTDDINLIYRAIETNIPMALQWSSTAMSSIVVTFIYGWKMTLVMSAVLPVLITGAALASRGRGKKNMDEREAYAVAGTVAEQAFSNIKTVVAFGGEEKEAQRYFISLKRAQRSAVVMGYLHGIGLGIQWGFFYMGYALGFFYGGQLVRHQEYTVTQMMT